MTHGDFRPVGKVFVQNPDGSISTVANVAVSIWVARTLNIPTFDAFADLLRRQRARDALILDYVPGHTDGRAFLLVSDFIMKDPVTVAQLRQQAPVVQLKKDNFSPGGWGVFDWDFDKHRPAELCDSTVDEWWYRMCGVFPQLNCVGRVIAPSSKGRLLRPDGTPAYTSPSAHIYTPVDHAELKENLRDIGEARCWQAGTGYIRPGTRGQPLRRTVTDWSTWGVSRRVFESEPVFVAPGYTVTPPAVRVVPDTTLDLRNFPFPTAEEREQYKQMTARLLLQGDDSGRIRCSTSSEDLTLAQIIETQHHGNATVQEPVQWLRRSCSIRLAATSRQSLPFNSSRSAQ